MGLCQNVYRRGAVYWWRKKIVGDGSSRSYLIALSLNVREPARARSLAAQLNARFHAMERKMLSGQISRNQVRGVLAQMIRDEIEYRDEWAFCALNAPERLNLEPGEDVRKSLIRNERVVAAACFLAAKYGAALKIDAALEEEVRGIGFSQDDVWRVVDLIKVELPKFLSPGPDAYGPPEAYFKTLLHRFGVDPNTNNVQQFWREFLRVRMTALADAKSRYSRDLTGFDELYAQIAKEMQERPLSSPPPAPNNGIAAPPAPAVAAPEDHPLFIWGEKYLKKAQEKEGLRDAAHMRSLYRLFCQLLIELKVFGLADLRQSHIVALTELFDELPKSYGKSPRDDTLAGARVRGATLETRERGIDGKTINKHLSALNQLLEHLRDSGVKIDPDLAPNKLRFKIPGRQRGLRKSLTDEELSAVFALPCFTGCKGWRRREPFEKGSHVFHRAIYFAIILLYYLGARRNEICGLQIVDVVLDCAIPHILIRENSVRGVKNVYSERRVPLHPEILRLGFLEYVAAVKALGYSLVFPDLYSPTSLSPLGDRLYDEFMPALKVAIPEEGRRKKVIHSLRTTWGAKLKKAKVSSEERADTLGHSVKSVTEEVYADDTELADQLVNMMKLPHVTGHLQPAEINLLPWVQKKETAPFSQPNRSRKALPRS